MKKWQIYAEERQQGKTYREIAEKYGVSHQAVSQCLARRGDRIGFKPYTERECVYDGLRDWLNENCISRSEFARTIMDCHGLGGAWHERIRRRLDGTTGFRQTEINKVLKASGKTYEELSLHHEAGDVRG